MSERKSFEQSYLERLNELEKLADEEMRLCARVCRLEAELDETEARLNVVRKRQAELENNERPPNERSDEEWRAWVCAQK